MDSASNSALNKMGKGIHQMSQSTFKGPSSRFSKRRALVAWTASLFCINLSLAPPSIAGTNSELLSPSSSEGRNAEAAQVKKPEGGLIAKVEPLEPNASSTEQTKAKVQNKDADPSNASKARSFFDQERKSRKRKYAHASSTVFIHAPQALVWKILVDFEHYPDMFSRIKTCHITKRENGFLYAETYLKPQMFVKTLCQHTVTDITQGPNYVQWKMLDGNFSSVVGSWRLSTKKDKKGRPVCQADYVLEADPGPVIPSPLVSFCLHMIEHEVVSLFKQQCEKKYKQQTAAGTAGTAGSGRN
jgi:ribosome-associated toxin RatA of RatAB toxin-antitoxin module